MKRLLRTILLALAVGLIAAASASADVNISATGPDLVTHGLGGGWWTQGSFVRVFVNWETWTNGSTSGCSTPSAANRTFVDQINTIWYTMHKTPVIELSIRDGVGSANDGYHGPDGQYNGALPSITQYDWAAHCAAQDNPAGTNAYFGGPNEPDNALYGGVHLSAFTAAQYDLWGLYGAYLAGVSVGSHWINGEFGNPEHSLSGAQEEVGHWPSAGTNLPGYCDGRYFSGGAYDVDPGGAYYQDAYYCYMELTEGTSWMSTYATQWSFHDYADLNTLGATTNTCTSTSCTWKDSFCTDAGTRVAPCMYDFKNWVNEYTGGTYGLWVTEMADMSRNTCGADKSCGTTNPNSVRVQYDAAAGEAFEAAVNAHTATHFFWYQYWDSADPPGWDSALIDDTGCWRATFRILQNHETYTNAKNDSSSCGQGQ